MEQHLTMVYWKSDHVWLGKLLEHPEIMTQGETIEELKENLKDAYLAMFPLRGAPILYYENPTEPVAEEDWDILHG